MESALESFSDWAVTVDSCINNFSLSGNDSFLVGMITNVSDIDGLSWREMCETLLSSMIRPAPDLRRYARRLVNYLLMGVAGMTVACFGLIGNLLSAIVLTRKTMTTSTYSYLAALAVCDFLVVACTLVLLIKDTRRPDLESISWPPGDHDNFYIYPYVFPYLHPAAITLQVSSVWLTLAFTVDRYIMICHPFSSAPFCTVSRARRVIAGLVTASFLFNLPKFFEYRTVVVRPPPAAVLLAVADDVEVVGCDLTGFGKSRVFKQLYHSWLYIVFVFGVPFVTLFVLNGFLVNAVRKSRLRSRELRPSSVRTTPDVVADSHGVVVPAYQLEGLTTSPLRSPSPVSKRIDTTVMLIGVVIIFIVCQFPALVSRAMWAFAEDPSRAFTDLPLYALNETANFLVLLNSSVNIVPYYFFGRRFRRQFLALFCPCCEAGRRAGRRRPRCDSAVDSAVFSHSASHNRDGIINQHCI